MVMNQVTGELTNRDIALLVWLGVLLIGALVYRPAREGLGSILKLLLFSKLGVGLLALLAYEALVVSVFYRLGLWHWWMLKDALFWLFGSAAILFFNTTKATEEKHYFRKAALDNFKFAVILAFIINLYVFNLVTELILVPVVTSLAMLGAVAASKHEFEPVKKLVNWTMVGIGITFLVYAVINITTNFHDFATVKDLEGFLTPIVLTLTLLPFAYLLGLDSAYESLFVQVGFRITDKRLARYAKRQILSACRFRLSRISRFQKDFAYKIGPSDSRTDVAGVVSEFRAVLTVRERGQGRRTSD